MKLSTVIHFTLASSFFAAMTVQANDSLVGLYNCELNEAALSVQGMDLRASGYVFMDIEVAGVTGKRVGTYEVDEDYIVINGDDGYQLFLVEEHRLVSESLGVSGECVRAQTGNQLEGLWQAEGVSLQIRFGKDGVAESTYFDEPAIAGTWELLSPDSIAMTFRGNSASAANRKVYTFGFKSADQLELQSDNETTLAFDRVQ